MQFGSHVSVNSSAGAVHVAPLMAPQTDRGSGLWAYGEGAAPGLGGDGGAGSHATAGARAAGGAGAHAHATLPPGGGSGGAADGGAAGGGRVRNITFFFGGKSSVHHPIVRPGYHMRASMFIQVVAREGGRLRSPSLQGDRDLPRGVRCAARRRCPPLLLRLGAGVALRAGLRMCGRQRSARAPARGPRAPRVGAGHPHPCPP